MAISIDFSFIILDKYNEVKEDLFFQVLLKLDYINIELSVSILTNEIIPRDSSLSIK